jgi:ATP-binding cassette subfamily B protein
MLFVLVLSGIVLQVGNPQLIALFIDEGLGPARESRLTMLAISFIVVALVAQVFAVLSTYVSEKVGWTATNELRADLADHCLRLDMSFHKTRTPGEMIQRVDGDIDALSNFFSQFVLYVAGNLVLLAGVLLMLFLEDWRIAIPLAGFALISLTALVKLRSLAVPHWVATREKQAQFYGFVAEHLAAREDIRGNGARGYSVSRLRRFFREWMPLQVRSEVFSFGWIWAASQGIYTAGTVIALALSYLFWESGSLSIGSVYLIFHYNEMIRRPLDQIRDQINQLQAASASIVRVQELLQITNRIPDEGKTPLPAGPLPLRMSGVSFSYEGDDAVLRDINVSLLPGEVLGLIGRTGSGKKTIGRLLVRLYEIYAGEKV